jgi:hypothetical protein
MPMPLTRLAHSIFWTPDMVDTDGQPMFNSSKTHRPVTQLKMIADVYRLFCFRMCTILPCVISTEVCDAHITMAAIDRLANMYCARCQAATPSLMD